jgi:hypothetical protein
VLVAGLASLLVKPWVQYTSDLLPIVIPFTPVEQNPMVSCLYPFKA